MALTPIREPPMTETPHADLSRRERQIMDIIYRRGRATAAEVQEDLPGRLSDSAVRTMLRRLEEKGHLTHAREGPRYIYSATLPRDEARESAIDRLLRTFFEGSAEKAMEALLDRAAAGTSDEELDRLARRIEQVRKEGR